MENLTDDDINILLKTLVLYGGVFLVALLIFYLFRHLRYKIYKGPNNVSSISEGDDGIVKVSLPTLIHKLFSVTDEEMMNECGLDALCLLRVLKFGVKLAVVGIINAVWLLFLYKTAETENATNSLLVSISVANLPSGSDRLIGTVIAAYIIYGYCGYLILHELNWFIKLRHSFLSRKLTRNYTVFVQNIPEEYQSNSKLFEFFCKAYESEASVLEAHIAISCPSLKEKIKEREKKREESLKAGIGDEEKYRIKGEIKKLENRISVSVSAIKESIKESSRRGKGKLGYGHASEKTPLVSKSSDQEPSDMKVLSAGFVTFRSLRATQAALQMIQHSEPFKMKVQEAPQPRDVLWKNVGKSHANLQCCRLFSVVFTVILCFCWTYPVTFVTTLASVEGLKEANLNILKWVHGQGFIPSFLKESMESSLQSVIRWIDVSPQLQPFFEILAPFLVFILRKVLEVILTWLSKQDGPISDSVVQAHLFTKLSWFYIIQRFFVVSLSGSVLSELSEMVGRPEHIVNILATSLPSQSTFFIQILLVDSFSTVATELVKDILTYCGRKVFGKVNAPLKDPVSMEHGKVLANFVTYFMVFLVYATIAPITSVFVGICFLLMQATYRYQFIYVYLCFPDSGGRLWARFFRLLPRCIIISQVTLFGMISLKKSVLGAQLVCLLIFLTVLFNFYINGEDFKNSDFLPARDAIQADHTNREDANSEHFYHFVRNKYIQPELCIIDGEEKAII